MKNNQFAVNMIIETEPYMIFAVNLSMNAVSHDGLADKLS